MIANDVDSLHLTFQISDLDPLPESSEDPSTPSSPSAPNASADIDGAADEIDAPPYITVSLVIKKAGHPHAMSVDMEAGEEGMVVTNVAMFESEVAMRDDAEGDWIRSGKYMGPRKSIF